jgi:hypothetical protein
MDTPIYVLIPTTPGRKERLKRCVKSIKKSRCDQGIEIVVDVNNYKGAVKSLLRLFNKVNGLALFLGDDTWIFPDTIQRLYDAYIKAFPENDGMAVATDESVHKISFAHPFAHTQVFRQHTFPGYFHNFVDREWQDRMKFLNKYVEVPMARIMHNHFTKDSYLFDQTYKIGQDTSDADGKIFYERRGRNFDL